MRARSPPGEGAARSIGRALAAIHSLPASVVRAAGLQEHGAARTRRCRARARQGGCQRTCAGAPHGALARGDRRRQALVVRADNRAGRGRLPRHSCFGDDERGAPVVTGVYDWHGLAVEDPAIDLRWLSAAQTAEDDVIDAYADAAHRVPTRPCACGLDCTPRSEFARWLLHETTRGATTSSATPQACSRRWPTTSGTTGCSTTFPATATSTSTRRSHSSGACRSAPISRTPRRRWRPSAYSPEDLSFAQARAGTRTLTTTRTTRAASPSAGVPADGAGGVVWLRARRARRRRRTRFGRPGRRWPRVGAVSRPRSYPAPSRAAFQRAMMSASPGTSVSSRSTRSSAT